MDSTVTAPRYDADPCYPTLVDAIAATGLRSRAAREPRMPVLAWYWRALPSHGLRERTTWFEAVRASLHAGATTADAFAIFALGDADEQIVFDAVSAYVGAHPVSVEHREAVVREAIDWVRRGLVFNRGAAFAALLNLGDEEVEVRLRGLRLVLAHDEIETVCRLATSRPSRATSAFLADWLQLLDAAYAPNPRGRAVVAGALAALTG